MATKKHLADQERALMGDPGLPEARRLDILARLEDRMLQALARLRGEDSP